MRDIETASLPNSDGGSISDNLEDESDTSGYWDASSGSGKDSRKSDDDSVNLEEQLTEQKSKAVNRLRAYVLIALVLAAFGVSITVFVLSRKADTEAFEIQYEGNVDKIRDAFEGIFTQVGAISALAADTTAHAGDLNASWPFQTLSNFHGRGGNARKLSGALYVSVNHRLANKELEDWESYVLGDENIWM